jgi:hypothetical protein
MPSISSFTPKELIAEPNQIGVSVPWWNAVRSSGAAIRAPSRPPRGAGRAVLRGYARQFRIVEPLHLHALGDLVAVGAVHQFQPVVDQVVAAEKVAPHADGPTRRRHVDGEVFLDFVNNLECIAAFAVHLVAKGQDRQIAQPADLEEFLRLALHALGPVDHHDGGIHGSERAIGILREIGVAGRVHEVEAVVPEIERHGRCGDRNAAILLHLHEVRPRAPRLALGAHLSRHLDRAAVKQELLRQRGLARVGMRDDREGTPPRDLGRQVGAVGLKRVGHGLRYKRRGRGPQRPSAPVVSLSLAHWGGPC